MAPVASPIGDNLARVRKARGLTQENLAATSQVSVDVIARLEQGRKKGARWTTLIKLANALEVQLAVLVTPPALLGDSAGPEVGNDIHALRRAITSVSDLIGTDHIADDDECVAVEQLQHVLRRVAVSYHRGEFTAVGQVLPGLISDAQRTVRDSVGDRRTAAHTALAAFYCMAAGVTVMRGHQDLAFTAVEKATESARLAGDGLPAAASATFLTWILIKQGRYEDAERVAVAAAERIEPSFTHGTRSELAAFGNLMINASCAAVRARANDRGEDLLSVARAAASRHGIDGIHQGSVFGPRVVAMYAACNAAETHNIEAALRHARAVPPAREGTLPPTWEARYLLNMAYVNSEAGNDNDAVGLLSRARDIAPEWIRYHPMAAAVTLEQLERPRKPSEQLAALATHLRVL